jgi:hypothetical protein
MSPKDFNLRLICTRKDHIKKTRLIGMLISISYWGSNLKGTLMNPNSKRVKTSKI